MNPGHFMYNILDNIYVNLYVEHICTTYQHSIVSHIDAQHKMNFKVTSCIRYSIIFMITSMLNIIKRCCYWRRLSVLEAVENLVCADLVLKHVQTARGGVGTPCSIRGVGFTF